MTETEFQREVLRGLRTIMHALIARYGMGWGDFMPREENGIIRALAEHRTHLAFQCSEHGPSQILSVFGSEMRLRCGCGYVFRDLAWVRHVGAADGQTTVPLAYEIKP